MLDRPDRAAADGLPKESHSALVDVLDRLDDLRRLVDARAATARDEAENAAVARLFAGLAELTALVDLATEMGQ